MPSLRSHLPTILSVTIVFGSLALIAFSIAVIYLTNHAMHIMDENFPSGWYQWYRGPEYDIHTKHKIFLQYDNANEGLIFTAGAVSCLVGLISLIASLTAANVR
jgi:hypothetical protein